MYCLRNDADALLFVFGKSNEMTYSKSLAVQYHFFGAEIPNMVIAVVPGAVYVVANPEVAEQIKTRVTDDAEVRGHTQRPSLPPRTELLPMRLPALPGSLAASQ